MNKNFAQWHAQKSQIDASELSNNLYFYEREIWWCSLGLNIGYEQDGKHGDFARPVLILRKFNRDILWILPLTGQYKSGIYYYPTTYKTKTSSIILSQLRLISSKRLLRKIRTLPKGEFEEVKNRVGGLI